MVNMLVLHYAKDSYHRKNDIVIINKFKYICWCYEICVRIQEHNARANISLIINVYGIAWAPSEQRLRTNMSICLLYKYKYI